ncbi:MAG: zinc ABC transporter substrate-binding protein, partial [Firmicutes bacterium]|nr:zinc ABC transporter substrate-binding protein [Bacillota bacterium]
SSETDASFETVTFLAKKVDELGLDSVMIIENSDGAIAQAIISNTETKDQKVLTMDSMQSVTADDIEAGETYLGIMEENLKVLQEALN